MLMKIKYILCSLVCIIGLQGTTIAQYWQSLNPGAGGRVQGVSCDPTTKGRMFVASDMEGFYYSNNYGTDWIWAGKDLPTAFMLKIEGRGNKFYVGHAKGLSVSTNKGATFQLASPTEDKTIGVIEIDPKNTNNVYAGINWRGNDGHLRHYPQTTTDTKELYYSHDGGNTWKKSSWANFANGDPRVQSIQVLPTNSNHVYIATSDGLYKSTNKGQSWSKVNGPSGIDSQYCWGADITSDGEWIYALYRKGGFTRLFAQKLSQGTWQDLGKGTWDSHNMWEPLVYQDGNKSKHYVLVSQRDQNPNEGLFEAEVSISGNTASASYSVIMNHTGSSASVNYDIGWNYYLANCRNKVYYPANWTNTGYTRGVFTQAQQSYFTGDAAKGNKDWRVVSTGYVKKQGGIDFYRSRGTASTFTYDVAGYGNYLIQGQADNLALESWDNGGSWVQSRTAYGVQDGHGVHVIPSNPAIVLMDAAAGFGGGNPAANSTLLYKEIDMNNPNHDWRRLAWGTAAADKKGLPKNRIWQFHADPNNYKRLYVITHSGLYLCEDIVSLIKTGAPYFKKIHTGSSLGAGLSINPSNTNEVYYKDNAGTYKGVRNGSGNYTWTAMTRSSGQTNLLNWGGVATVNKGGNTYVYTYERGKGIVKADNGSTQFNGTAVLSDNNLFNYFNKPDWFDASHHDIQTNAMYADGSTLYITYHTWEDVRWGYGIVKGTVNNDGSVNWQNWTSDLHYSTTKQMKKIDGKLYLATQGAGLLARKVNGGTADALPPIKEDDWENPFGNLYYIFSDFGSTLGLNWGGTGDVESSPSAGQAAEGGNSRYVQGLNQSVAPGADHTITIDFSPLDVSGGTLSLNGYGIGGGLFNLNIKVVSSDGGFKDNLSQSISANKWGQISIPLSGGSFNAKSFNRIIIERWGGGSDRCYLDKIYISGTDVKQGEDLGGGDISVTGLSATPASVTLESNQTQQIAVSVTPSNATNKSVTYQSNNTSIATVNSSGMITAVGQGSTSITVRTVDGGFTDNVAVTVANGDTDCDRVSSGGKPNPPCSVWAEVTSNTSVILHWVDNSNNEDYFDIQAQKPAESYKAAGMPDAPANATSIAIDGLTANSKYSFRIKAFNSNGGSNWTTSEQVDLSTAGSGTGDIDVTGVTMTPASSSIEEGETVQLNVSVSPSNATNKNVTYTSSNSNIVSVNNSGLVTAVSEGSATVTVTTADGSFTDQTSITVTSSNSNPPSGNGDCSATSSGGKPNPPCGVWAEVLSSTSVKLHWNDNSNNEDYFDIQAQLQGDSFRASGMPDGAKNTSSVVINNLAAGAKYSFRIKSFNSNGGSSWVTTDQVNLGSSGARFANTRIELPATVELNIYPIPSNGLITISSNIEGSGKVLNSVGQVVKSISWIAGKVEIDLGLKSGIYILISDDLKSKKRLIINN